MRHNTPRIGSHLTRIITAVGLVAGALVFAAPAAQAINVASVSAGAVHACVRTTAGVAKCWGFNGVGNAPTLNKEPLTFNYVKPVTRSYK